MGSIMGPPLEDGFVVLRFLVLVEADVLRLARLSVEAVEACGGRVFRAAAVLNDSLPLIRAARTGAGGLLEVRLVAAAQGLFLCWAEQSFLLSECPERSQTQICAIAARLREESESQDPDVLLERSREAARLAAAQAEALESLEYRLAEKRRALEVVTLQADTDPLTGLLNRRAYDVHLDQALVRAATASTPLSLLFLDIDHFKAVNDSEGHAGGDRALRHVADVLRVSVRGDDLAFRTGGDEFAVIVTAPLEIARDIATRILAALEGGVSVGMTSFRRDDTGSSLAVRADQALYRAKNKGRGQVVSV